MRQMFPSAPYRRELIFYDRQLAENIERCAREFVAQYMKKSAYTFMGAKKIEFAEHLLMLLNFASPSQRESLVRIDCFLAQGDVNSVREILNRFPSENWSPRDPAWRVLVTLRHLLFDSNGKHVTHESLLHWLANTDDNHWTRDVMQRVLKQKYGTGKDVSKLEIEELVGAVKDLASDERETLSALVWNSKDRCDYLKKPESKWVPWQEFKPRMNRYECIRRYLLENPDEDAATKYSRVGLERILYQGQPGFLCEFTSGERHWLKPAYMLGVRKPHPSPSGSHMHFMPDVDDLIMMKMLWPSETELFEKTRDEVRRSGTAQRRMCLELAYLESLFYRSRCSSPGDDQIKAAQQHAEKQLAVELAEQRHVNVYLRVRNGGMVHVSLYTGKKRNAVEEFFYLRCLH